jgi:hypothetical protein
MGVTVGREEPHRHGLGVLGDLLNVMVGVSAALLVATFGGLITWNARYVAKTQRS